jgi:DNA-directed RNA polymerase subunit RPC12/RpoP
VFKIILSLLFFITFIAPKQQDEQLEISLRRNWGFSSGTGKIQGTFTIRTNGPKDLTKVTFTIDEQAMGEANEEPFELRFATDDYPLGVHQIQASGSTAGGIQLQSNTIRVEFVSASQGWQAASNIIIPIVVVILAAIGLAVLVPLVFTRGKKEQLAPGAPRSYGVYGGAVCPKCTRPFSRHIYGLNLGTHKYDRCPYCGKWSLVRRASPQELANAEAAEIETAAEGAFVPGRTEEELLREEIEDSRYDDI